MKQYEEQIFSLAIKIVDFSAQAEALVARNILGALLSEKETII